MGKEGTSRSEVSSEEATEESSSSRRIDVVGMGEPPVPACEKGASHLNRLEVGCARVLAIEKFWEHRVGNSTQRGVCSGVATFDMISGKDCMMTPVIP